VSGACLERIEVLPYTLLLIIFFLYTFKCAITTNSLCSLHQAR
jgi:hypothetical protein